MLSITNKKTLLNNLILLKILSNICNSKFVTAYFWKIYNNE